MFFSDPLCCQKVQYVLVAVKHSKIEIFILRLLKYKYMNMVIFYL